jgi:hypothetical protein
MMSETLPLNITHPVDKRWSQFGKLNTAVIVCVTFCSAAFITLSLGNTATSLYTTSAPTVTFPATVAPVLRNVHGQVVTQGTTGQISQLAASDSVSELNVRDFVEPAAPQGLPFWSALLAVPAVFIAAVSLGRRAGSPRVLDPLNIDALPSNRVAMAGLFGNKQPGEQAVPSMAEMSKAIESLGGPAALQEAAKSLSTETLKEMAEITKQMVSKGPESLTLQQQQVMIKVQMEMLTVLKSKGIKLTAPMETLLSAVELKQAKAVQAGQAAP